MSNTGLNDKVRQRAFDAVYNLLFAKSFFNPLAGFSKIFVNQHQAVFATLAKKLVRLGYKLVCSQPGVILFELLPVGFTVNQHNTSIIANALLDKTVQMPCKHSFPVIFANSSLRHFFSPASRISIRMHKGII